MSYFALLCCVLIGIAIVVMSTATVRAGSRRTCALISLPVALYFPTVTAVLHASSRYQWPAIDILVPFAASGAAALLARASLFGRQRVSVPQNDQR